MNRISASFCAMLLAGAASAQSESGYHLVKKIPLPGEGTYWDYLFIDREARRLYVSHTTQVEVIDLGSETPVGKVTGMAQVHGIAVAPKLGRGFITSGNTSSVKMFDLKTLQSLADIPAGNGPDGVIFEPVTKRVFAFNHRGGTLTVIDAASGKVLENIELGGQPEFPVVDGKGTVWVNNEDKSMLLKIDAKTIKIVERWPVAPCEAPASMAMDQKHRRLFIGCNSKVMAVADADSGQSFNPPNCWGVDAPRVRSRNRADIQREPRVGDRHPPDSPNRNTVEPNKKKPPPNKTTPLPIKKKGSCISRPRDLKRSQPNRLAVSRARWGVGGFIRGFFVRRDPTEFPWPWPAATPRNFDPGGAVRAPNPISIMAFLSNRTSPPLAITLEYTDHASP